MSIFRVLHRLHAAAFVACAALVGCAPSLAAPDPAPSSTTLFDPARQRPVPVTLYMPAAASRCTLARPCPVAMISSGYGIGHEGYSFLAEALGGMGYLAVAVQHELPSDPPLATKGDLYAARTSNWQHGAANLHFVRDTLRISHPGFDWDHLVLVGHSNGGDISAWFARESEGFAGRLVTLDSRRVPLPRGPSSPPVLSIRASDFQADPGVLPDAEELALSGSCVVRIPDARHNDMHDGGPPHLKTHIAELIVGFLESGSCGTATLLGRDAGRESPTAETQR